MSEHASAQPIAPADAAALARVVDRLLLSQGGSTNRADLERALSRATRDELFRALTAVEARGVPISNARWEGEDEEEGEAEEEETPKIDEFTNTEFECPKCGARRSSVVYKQMRGMDEGMTAIVTCGACGGTFNVDGR